MHKLVLVLGCCSYFLLRWIDVSASTKQCYFFFPFNAALIYDRSLWDEDFTCGSNQDKKQPRERGTVWSIQVEIGLLYANDNVMHSAGPRENQGQTGRRRPMLSPIFINDKNKGRCFCGFFFTLSLSLSFFFSPPFDISSSSSLPSSSLAHSTLPPLN